MTRNLRVACRPRTALAYLGSRLTTEAFVDDGIRQQAFEAGLATVATFPALDVVRQSPHTCTVTVAGPEEELERLRHVLEETGRGDLSFEDTVKPAFRAAPTNSR